MTDNGLSCLDPNTIVAGIEKIVPKRHHIPFVWTKAVNFSTGNQSYIPKQLIDMPYIQVDDEALLRISITTGAACGASQGDAIKRGFLELVERDAFMLSWLTRSGLTKINKCLESISKSSLLFRSIHEVNRYNLKPNFFKMLAYGNLPAVVCVLRDDSGVGVPFSIGAKCSETIKSAILGALEEAIQLRHWLRTIDSVDKKEYSEPNTLRERGLLTQKPEYQEKLNDWLKTSCSGEELSSCELDKHHDVTFPADLFFVDLSYRMPEKVKDLQFSVVKCVVPSFQPLFLTETLSDLAWNRILPRLGSNVLNPTPHPFL